MGLVAVVKKYSLSIVLSVLFVAFWIAQTVMGWIEFQHEATAHGEVAWLADYAAVWARATFENWQSEFLQLAAFVILSSVLIHAGSPQSKDGDERMEGKVDMVMTQQDVILHKISELEAGSRMHWSERP